MRKIIPLVAAAALLTGCAKHYQVTQPSSGSTYYTKSVKHRHGKISFKDAATGNKVTLDDAEVEKISKSEFKEAVGN